jgi:hypothetical protein
MLSVIRPPELSHGTAESCRIADTMTVPKPRIRSPEYQEREDPTALRLNRLLEVPSINAGPRACPVRARASSDGHIIWSGDDAEIQTKIGDWVVANYRCEFDPQTSAVISATLNLGKLPQNLAK